MKVSLLNVLLYTVVMDTFIIHCVCMHMAVILSTHNIMDYNERPGLYTARH